MPTLFKTPSEVRDDYLKDIENGLADLGIANADQAVAEGSDYFVEATAIAYALAPLYNNVEVQSDALMPDTATGEDLDRILSNFGLARRSAGAAYGQITIECSTSTLVATSTQLISSKGIRYEVITGGTFSNGDAIDIRSIDLGTKGNLGIGATLTWVGTPAFTKATCLVSRDLAGGVDAEDDETARARLLSRLANPPGSGNWQEVAEIAEAADPSVQKAFIYPAANGPSTLHVAVAGYPSLTTKSREIDSNKMQLITPYIQGKLFEGINIVTTTVEDVEVDVAFLLTIPLSTASTSVISGPGTGGGWLDATPFPTVNLDTHYYCRVVGHPDSTSFTLDAPVNLPPIPGVTRIHWIDRSTWTVKQAIVTSTSGSGPYTLTIDSPFVGIEAGDWIFPASVNAQTYLDAILDAFKNMGPGEKTNAPAILERAYRNPRPSKAYPYALDSVLLKALNNSSDEVETSAFSYRGLTPATTQAATSAMSPALPTVITDPPKIFIPKILGFYPGLSI